MRAGQISVLVFGNRLSDLLFGRAFYRHLLGVWYCLQLSPLNLSVGDRGGLFVGILRVTGPWSMP